MAGTTVFYNGIFLQDCEMMEFRQVIEQDESNTDHLYSRFRIKVGSCLCRTILSGEFGTLTNEDVLRSAEPPNHGSITTIAPNDLADTISAASHESRNTGWETKDISLSEHHAFITKFLKEPRKDFWMAIHGQGATDDTLAEVPYGAQETLGGTTRPEYLSVLGATGMTRADALLNDPLIYPTNGDSAAMYLAASRIERDYVLDTHNGPRPIGVTVQKIAGGRMMRIEFEIEIAVYIGPSKYINDTRLNAIETAFKEKGARKTIGVASNRWSVTESLNEDWQTTHTIKGQLVVRDHTYKPHAQRMLTVPWMFPYAKMTRREFRTDPTGLTLNYEHTFSECGDAPPYGVVNWKGTYSEQVLGGGKSFGSVSVRVVGTAAPPRGLTASEYKKLLITQAFRIILSRISLSLLVDAQVQKPGQRASKTILQEATVIEQMDQPVIDVKATVLHSPEVEKVEGNVVQDPLNAFGLRLTVMGDPIISTTAPAPLGDPDYKRYWWPIPSSFTWDWKRVRDMQASVSNPTPTEGNPRLKGSYFDCYFQSPEFEWHGIPLSVDIPDRLDTAPASNPYIHTNTSGADITKEYLNFNFRGYGGNGRPLPEVEHTAETAAVKIVQHTLLNTDVQDSGFAYLTYESKTTVNGANGVVMVPLSKARTSSILTMFGGPPDGSGVSTPEDPPSDEALKPKDTSVAVRLHAPTAYRDYTVVATREGEWPKVPQPSQTTQTATGGTETLLSQEVVAMTPKPGPDDRTLIYGVECRWRYAMSRPPGYGHYFQGKPLQTPWPTIAIPSVSGTGFDKSVIELGANPMYRATPNDTQLPLAGFYDRANAQYTT
jgi:hypothetical protein